jgi:alkanesulfonate monooxygenase SsuD/methylene tetrahydromethanopterin reductase-like flavin-dependent oxidoreductase (luciferase family)
VPPEDLTERLALYREGLGECTEPVGKFKNERAATFTMVHCAPTDAEAFADAEESVPWYVKTAVGHIASLSDWMEGQDLGTYSYAGDLAKVRASGALDHLTFDFLRDTGSAVVGGPERCVEIARRYEAAGCDLLLCLVNPYKIPHDKVMKSIELLGERVLPHFDVG